MKSPIYFLMLMRVVLPFLLQLLFAFQLLSSLSTTMMISTAQAATSTNTVSSSTSLNRNQEKVNHAWNNLVNDFDQFKNIFADDATIKMCLQGMPHCTEGTFVEMLEGFRVAFTRFQVKHIFLTGTQDNASKTNNAAGKDTFLVEWVNSIETKDGCQAMWWGYATYEFNENGKIKRFLGLSDESEDVLQCVSKLPGIHAEL